MSKPDYYEVLGVERDADDATIKKAYRKAAYDNHPDRNPGDKAAEERFKMASEAFDVLSSTEKRATYDRFGHEGLEGSGFGGFSHAGVEDIFARFGDIFSNFFGEAGGPFGAAFGGGRRRRSRERAQQGENIGIRLTLAFEDAVRGTKRDISVPRQVPCDACEGRGHRGGGMVACQTCGGAGQVRRGGGMFIIATTCPTCEGSGEMLRDPCGVCRGTGRVSRESKLTVTVPPGVTEDVELRLAGQGESGVRGGPPGDLFVQFDVRGHKVFERHESDLHCEVKVNVADAALGGTIEVSTLDGPKPVELRAGTQSGDEVRVKGAGVPAFRNRPAGDVVAHVTVETPRNLTARQAELLREFRETLKPRKKGFFEKLVGE